MVVTYVELKRTETPNVNNLTRFLQVEGAIRNKGLPKRFQSGGANKFTKNKAYGNSPLKPYPCEPFGETQDRPFNEEHYQFLFWEGGIDRTICWLVLFNKKFINPLHPLHLWIGKKNKKSRNTKCLFKFF